MGSTFSSAFENIHLEYRAVRSTFSSAFKIIHNLKIEVWFDIQLCIRNNTQFECRATRSKFSSIFENIHPEYRAMRSTFSFAYNNIHIFECPAVSSTFRSAFKTITLWIFSYGLDIQLYIRKHSSLISSCGIDIQLCIQHQTHFEYQAIGSTFSSAFENIHLKYRAVR